MLDKKTQCQIAVKSLACVTPKAALTTIVHGAMLGNKGSADPMKIKWKLVCIW